MLNGGITALITAYHLDVVELQNVRPTAKIQLNHLLLIVLCSIQGAKCLRDLTKPIGKGYYLPGLENYCCAIPCPSGQRRNENGHGKGYKESFHGTPTMLLRLLRIIVSPQGYANQVQRILRMQRRRSI